MQNDEMFERTVKPVLDVNEKPQPAQWAFLSLQHLFAMFGATVLVPFLTGLPISAALLASGIGTLLYILITKAQIPAYLGSSFAFITPIITGLSTHSLGDMLVALFMSGVMYVIIGILIKLSGTAWLMKLLPPVVVGPVIMVIGLSLAPTAVNMAMYENPGDMKGYNISFLIVAMITLLVTIAVQGFFKGFLSLIPVLVGIIVGYVVAIFMGIVKFDAIMSAKWIDFPHIYLPFKDYVPSFHLGLVLVMIPSVLAITRIYSIYVIGGAAVIAIVLAFIGKFTALISSIPTPVMGGVSILLFGIIAASGLRMLVESKVDFANNRNLVIASVILVVGIGNLVFNLKEIGINLQIEGMALAALSGIILNLILPKEKKQNN